MRSMDGIEPVKRKTLNDNNIFTIAHLAFLLDDETRLARVQDAVDRNELEERKAQWNVRHYAEIAFDLLAHGTTNGDSGSEDDDRHRMHGEEQVALEHGQDIATGDEQYNILE